eukprot:GEMP01009078.1.p1 GENE.GEMP01009078.1~~GEMP01009078.1.p1  ORF type:complete len:248 (+),score=50.27 GEMP01009078.1:138-881(+)
MSRAGYLSSSTYYPTHDGAPWYAYTIFWMVVIGSAVALFAVCRSIMRFLFPHRNCWTRRRNELVSDPKNKQKERHNKSFPVFSLERQPNSACNETLAHSPVCSVGERNEQRGATSAAHHTNGEESLEASRLDAREEYGDHHDVEVDLEIGQVAVAQDDNRQAEHLDVDRLRLMRLSANEERRMHADSLRRQNFGACVVTNGGIRLEFSAELAVEVQRSIGCCGGRNGINDNNFLTDNSGVHAVGDVL